MRGQQGLFVKPQGFCSIEGECEELQKDTKKFLKNCSVRTLPGGELVIFTITGSTRTGNETDKKGRSYMKEQVGLDKVKRKTVESKRY